ncbi:MAG: type II toxin-antitoxin system VapC family toxin [Dyadobacter sp.]
MNYILDTHTLIWFIEGNDLLSKTAQKAIEDEKNVKYVSIASIWEIAIKISLRKLFLKKDFDRFLNDLFQTNIEILPITTSHLVRVSTLDFFHKDPFDRIIISQSLEEDFKVIGRDQNFQSYNVELYW